MPSAIFYTTEMGAYGMGHRGASSRPGVIVGPRPSDRGSARRCRAWRRRRCTSQHPTSPSTSLTSYVGQEIIVANNTVCSSCLTSWSPSRPGSRDVPVMWLALSEFHYCRHNNHFVALCYVQVAVIHRIKFLRYYLKAYKNRLLAMELKHYTTEVTFGLLPPEELGVYSDVSQSLD